MQRVLSFWKKAPATGTPTSNPAQRYTFPEQAADPLSPSEGMSQGAKPGSPSKLARGSHPRAPSPNHATVDIATDNRAAGLAGYGPIPAPQSSIDNNASGTRSRESAIEEAASDSLRRLSTPPDAVNAALAVPFQGQPQPSIATATLNEHHPEPSAPTSPVRTAEHQSPHSGPPLLARGGSRAHASSMRNMLLRAPPTKPSTGPSNAAPSPLQAAAEAVLLSSSQSNGRATDLVRQLLLLTPQQQEQLLRASQAVLPDIREPADTATQGGQGERLLRHVSGLSPQQQEALLVAVKFIASTSPEQPALRLANATHVSASDRQGATTAVTPPQAQLQQPSSPPPPQPQQQARGITTEAHAAWENRRRMAQSTATTTHSVRPLGPSRSLASMDIRRGASEVLTASAAPAPATLKASQSVPRLALPLPASLAGESDAFAHHRPGPHSSADAPPLLVVREDGKPGSVGQLSADTYTTSDGEGGAWPSTLDSQHYSAEVPHTSAATGSTLTGPPALPISKPRESPAPPLAPAPPARLVAAPAAEASRAHAVAVSRAGSSESQQASTHAQSMAEMALVLSAAPAISPAVAALLPPAAEAPLVRVGSHSAAVTASPAHDVAAIETPPAAPFISALPTYMSELAVNEPAISSSAAVERRSIHADALQHATARSSLRSDMAAAPSAFGRPAPSPGAPVDTPVPPLAVAGLPTPPLRPASSGTGQSVRSTARVRRAGLRLEQCGPPAPHPRASQTAAPAVQPPAAPSAPPSVDVRPGGSRSPSRSPEPSALLLQYAALTSRAIPAQQPLREPASLSVSAVRPLDQRGLAAASGSRSHAFVASMIVADRGAPRARPPALSPALRGAPSVIPSHRASRLQLGCDAPPEREAAPRCASSVRALSALAQAQAALGASESAGAADRGPAPAPAPPHVTAAALRARINASWSSPPADAPGAAASDAPASPEADEGGAAGDAGRTRVVAFDPFSNSPVSMQQRQRFTLDREPLALFSPAASAPRLHAASADPGNGPGSPPHRSRLLPRTRSLRTPHATLAAQWRQQQSHGGAGRLPRKSSASEGGGGEEGVDGSGASEQEEGADEGGGGVIPVSPEPPRSLVDRALEEEVRPMLSVLRRTLQEGGGGARSPQRKAADVPGLTRLDDGGGGRVSPQLRHAAAPVTVLVGQAHQLRSPVPGSGLEALGPHFQEPPSLPGVPMPQWGAGDDVTLPTSPAPPLLSARMEAGRASPARLPVGAASPPPRYVGRAMQGPLRPVMVAVGAGFSVPRAVLGQRAAIRLAAPAAKPTARRSP